MKPYHIWEYDFESICSQAPKLWNALNKNEGFHKKSTI